MKAQEQTAEAVVREIAGEQWLVDPATGELIDRLADVVVVGEDDPTPQELRHE